VTAPAGKTALIIGASRGLGYALAAEYLARGWRVTATVRGARRTRLHDLARSSDGRLVVETVDVTVPEQVAALHDRLARAPDAQSFARTADDRSAGGGAVDPRRPGSGVRLVPEDTLPIPPSPPDTSRRGEEPR
jgi:NAD(P)-dependent dehydrogenase (short-subunit alcohol dehydrogenase family)